MERSIVLIQRRGCLGVESEFLTCIFGHAFEPMSEALREAARRRRRAASLRASGLGPRQAGSGDELLGCLGGPLPGLMPLRARWPRILVMTLCSRMTSQGSTAV